jgi:TolA-binding protein
MAERYNGGRSIGNENVKRRSIGAACIITVAALVVAATLHSCAYFNTLYNARRIYREAEKAGEKEGSGREQRDKYRDVVAKCSQVVQVYPKSRWVDDAIFLMGKALVKQDEYDKAIRQFQEILTNFPKSGYVPDALYWLAYSYYMKKDDAQALTYVDRVLKEYPKNEIRYEALFLGGDIKREMEDDEGALDFYARASDEAKKREIVDEARLRSAELFRSRGEWEKAAASYEKLLRKGIAWERRLRISRALAECYTNMGKCHEALNLLDGLIAKASATQEIPPLLLGRAASYACMDSLARALAVYDEIAVKYPRSSYSAEAYYRKGVIYHERLDSLRLAQEAFSKVEGEYAKSEFALASIEKSGSMRRLLELQQGAAGKESVDQAAEKRFLAAEIQLTRLGDVRTALAGYRAVLDSFPGTAVAPKAAYAIAWIQQYKLNDHDKAVDRYRILVERYPRSYQAKGALFQLGFLGADSLEVQLRSYVDSALADTTAIERFAPPALPDTVGAAGRDVLPAAADTAGAARREAPPLLPDTLSSARRETTPAPPDTSHAGKKGGAE